MAARTTKKPKQSKSNFNGPPLPASEVLTLAEAAAFLRVPEAGLRVDAEAGRVPGRLVAGQWRFARSMLLAWLSQVEVQPTTNKSSPAMPFRIEETPEEQAAFWASIQAFRDDVNRATRSGKYAPE